MPFYIHLYDCGFQQILKVFGDPWFIPFRGGVPPVYQYFRYVHEYILIWNCPKSQNSTVNVRNYTYCRPKC